MLGLGLSIGVRVRVLPEGILQCFYTILCLN